MPTTTGVVTMGTIDAGAQKVGCHGTHAGRQGQREAEHRFDGDAER